MSLHNDTDGQNMTKNDTIQIRINHETKESAKEVLSRLHISMSDAIALFLQQVSLTKSIPFDIKIPNEETAQAIENIRTRKNLSEYNSVDEMFEDIS
ncbi:MAG: type II toxin-antitoxin system RelB/DinJ family antitoxin [Sedimentisphaeraceae bacterium JB056]